MSKPVMKELSRTTRNKCHRRVMDAFGKNKILQLRVVDKARPIDVIKLVSAVYLAVANSK